MLMNTLLLVVILACTIINFYELRGLMVTIENVTEDLEVIKEGLNTLSNGLDVIVALIADLKAQIGAGVPVTQEQLDALDVATEEIKAALDSLKVKQDAAVA